MKARKRTNQARGMTPNVEGAPVGSGGAGSDLHSRPEGLNVWYKCRPITVAPTAMGEAVPIWFAALLASRCQATVNGDAHAIRWDRVSNRALYTNTGTEVEVIEPLGVEVECGQTVAVSWLANETVYTVEVYPERNLACA